MTAYLDVVLLYLCDNYSFWYHRTEGNEFFVTIVVLQFMELQGPPQIKYEET